MWWATRGEEGSSDPEFLPQPAHIEPLVCRDAAFHQFQLAQEQVDGLGTLLGAGGLAGRLVYRSSWPRPLRIEGRATGRRNGTVQMEFWIGQPNVFRAADLRRYMSDESVDWVHYELRAVMDDGEVWADGPDNFDYSAITCFGHVGYESLSMDSRRWLSRRFAATFAPGRRGASLASAGTDRTLLQELPRGPVGFTITAGRGRRGPLELVGTHLRSHP